MIISIITFILVIKRFEFFTTFVIKDRPLGCVVFIISPTSCFILSYSITYL